jgi:NCAIR mutase (PurE)-related protein
MTESELQKLVDDVAAGTIAADEASARILDALRSAPYDDLGFARVDQHRHLRQGFPEVVLGIGKTPAQIAAIADRIVARGHSLLVTRATLDAYEAVRETTPGVIFPRRRRLETTPGVISVPSARRGRA